MPDPVANLLFEAASMVSGFGAVATQALPFPHPLTLSSDRQRQLQRLSLLRRTDWRELGATETN